MQPQELLHVPEVVWHEHQARVVGHVCRCVLVLVEGDEPAFAAQRCQDQPGVASTSERCVHIHPVGVDVQRFQGLCRHDGLVVTHWGSGLERPLSSITPSARPEKSSGSSSNN